MVLAKKRIQLPMYNCSMDFLVSENVKIVVDGLYKKLKLKEELDGEAEGVLLTADINKYYLIIDQGYLTHNTIAHEMSHAVDRITLDRGIEDGESRAWLNGHLTGLIYKFLEKQKIIVKHVG